MLGFIKTLQKRPSDRTILISRTIFGLLYIAVMYYNFFLQENPNAIQSVIFGFELSEMAITYITYGIIAIGIVPIIMGLTNLCIAKKKIMRIVQVVFAIVLFFIAGIIEDVPNLDVDVFVTLMGLLPLFAGITGKCITSKCLKYGQKVTKIRV